MSGAKGYHVMLDFQLATPIENAKEFSDWLMQVCENSLSKYGIRIVHKHAEVFDGTKSPPGFAQVLLLDESHCTAHCYSDDGLIAIDIFSCGKEAAKKTHLVGFEIEHAIKDYATGKGYLMKTLNHEKLRFLYH